MKSAIIIAAGSFLSASLFAASEPSEIFAYGGGYKSSAAISAGPQSVPGTAKGSFKVSKRKENGTLRLVSVLDIGGEPLVIEHRLTLRGRKAKYVLKSQFLTVPGSLKSRISSRLITYRGKVTYGATPARVDGKIRRTNNGLLIREETDLGTGSQIVTYKLKSKRGK